MSEDRDLDKKTVIIPMKGTRKPAISKDVLKSAYIARGMSPQEIAEEYVLNVSRIEELVETEKWGELRKAYIVEGVEKLQNTQLEQAHKLMDLESNFKKMRILQLEKELEDYLAYYSRHGHFYKTHPVTGEILRNNDGIPLQIRLPNVSKELAQLKEAVTMSSGVRDLLNRLDDIINTVPKQEVITDPGVIDVDYRQIFGDDE